MKKWCAFEHTIFCQIPITDLIAYFVAVGVVWGVGGVTWTAWVLI